MYIFKIQSKSFFRSLFIVSLLITISTELILPKGNFVLAEQENISSYTLNFTPPNKGQSTGNGTKKPKRTAARSLGNLQAIIPQIGTEPLLQRPIHQGRTIASHPVFWLSYESKSDVKTPIVINLEIRDAHSNGQTYFYQNSFSLIQNFEPNIPIQLPQDAPSLKERTKYQWKFIASRDGKIVGETIGYIERISLPSDVTEQLLNAELASKLEIYAQWGIWHELLDTLAQLKQGNPRESRFENAWENLSQQYLTVSSN